MSPQRSAFAVRVTALAVAALALLGVVTPHGSAFAAKPAAEKSAAPIVASLTGKSASVAVGHAFSYNADIRLPLGASYMQTVFEVTRPDGQIVFKRTKLAFDVREGDVEHYEFSRDLTDVLELEPGTYPVKLQLTATVQGSTVTTELASSLRVYSADGPPVRLALVARVSGKPMTSPDGRFAVDPAVSTGARDAVSRISRRVLADPRARVTLSVPPMLLAEWRRLSGGYTLASGVAVRPDAPVAVAYNAALADLKAALDTERLELAAVGYSDPNLTDLADHGLTKDVGPQYDAGISAVFASLEVTPSPVSAPAGSCVPANQVDILSAKGVRYIVVDDDCAHVGKSRPSAGPYRLAHDEMRAIVTEGPTTAALSRADTETVIEEAFGRLMREPRQPLTVSIEIDGDATATATATDTVGIALDTFEALPWAELIGVSEAKPAPSTPRVRLSAGSKTPHAPKGFWKTVKRARSYASGYYAALGSGDPAASTAEVQSLVSEASSWSAPRQRWSSAARGLEFAKSSLKTTQPVLDSVTMKVQALTLSGSSGRVPITIVNGTSKTLAVVVQLSSTGGVEPTGETKIAMTLRPQENYLEVPVTMRRDLNGKLVVNVLAGDLVIAHSQAKLRASYLDRLAIIGAIVLLGLGVLVFIVRRVRSTPEGTVRDDSGAQSDWADDVGDEVSTR